MYVYVAITLSEHISQRLPNGGVLKHWGTDMVANENIEGKEAQSVSKSP